MLGAAPNENGVLAGFWSLLPVLAFPNENRFSEKRGLAAVEVSVVPPNKELGGSLDAITDGERSPKVNSEGVVCFGILVLESAPVRGACDVDGVTSSEGGVALGNPPKSVDGAV